MPNIKYKEIAIRQRGLDLIEQCNRIIEEYQADNLMLTLRQLYYQLVSRDLLANKLQEYNRLGSVVNDGRLAGLIDWEAIEDRTRNLAALSHWNSPADIIKSAAHSFRLDKWDTQPMRVEVWIEKEALAGVFQRICQQLDVAYFACRGYTSQSEMWVAAMRFLRYIQDGKNVTVLHFGDHDPSGIDMTRDIEDRIRMFIAHHQGDSDAFAIKRIALNMDQVRKYKPPKNPAKSTDSRFESYRSEFGESSWELDALNPRVLSALVRDEVHAVRDDDEWMEVQAEEDRLRATLSVTATNWLKVEKHIAKTFGKQIEQTEAKVSDEEIEDSR